MRNLTAFILFAFSSPVFGQPDNQTHIFNDTSLYFIHQLDSLHPVPLTDEELVATELLLMQAIEEFNHAEQRYADSVNPKKKKRGAQALRLTAESYNFRLIPVLNSNGEKMIRISGSCRGKINSGKTKKAVYDKDWKRNFIDGNMVADGGTCFISAVINLTLKEHSRLGINGMA